MRRIVHPFAKPILPFTRAIGLALVLIMAAIADPCLGQSFRFSTEDRIVMDMAEIIRRTDKRDGEWLANYLKHDSLELAEYCVKGFGQIGDSAYYPLVEKELKKAISTHQSSLELAAVNAIGLMGNSGAEDMLLLHLEQALTSRTIPEVNRERLKIAYFDALGRCGGQKALDFLNHWNKPDIAVPGIYQCYYRLGLRGKKDSQSIVNMWGLRKLGTEKNDLFLCHYLARCAGPEIKEHGNQIVQLLQTDWKEKPEWASQAVLALGKCDAGEVTGFLLGVFQGSSAFVSVQINAMRALSKLQIESADSLVLPSLAAINPNIATAAGEYFLARRQWDPLKMLAKLPPKSNPRGLAYFLKACSIELQAQKAPKEHYRAIAKEMENGHYQTSNPYYQAEFQAALMSIPNLLESNEKSLLNQLGKSEPKDKLIAQYMLEAWWAQAEREATPDKLSYFSDALHRQFIHFDIASITLLAEIAQREVFGFNQTIQDWQFALKWMDRLELPKETETYYALADLQAWTLGLPHPPHPKPEWNHPPSLHLLSRFSKNVVVIETTKGKIRVQLRPDIAPCTVASFIQLVDKNYYKGKTFHRIVPNFVVQGGCPRGDGWGSLDYSIRSEVGLPFTKGAIGMASAGKDTEGVQWFISLEPTPHLDGRYTCFGYVIGGWETLKYLELGDEILSIEKEF